MQRGSFQPELVVNAVRGLPEQLRRLWVPLAAMLGLWALTCGLLVVLAGQKGIELSDLSRDIAAIAGLPYYTGMLSTLGGMLWAAMAAVCFLGWALERRLGRPQHGFLLWAGVLAAVLGIDDAFMVHERIMPLEFGIPENAVLLAYALAATGFGVWYLRRILAADWLLFAIGIGGFAASLGVDKVFEHGSASSFMEDIFKFLGLVMWVTYYTRLTVGTLGELAEHAKAGQAIAAAEAFQREHRQDMAPKRPIEVLPLPSAMEPNTHEPSTLEESA